MLYLTSLLKYKLAVYTAAKDLFFRRLVLYFAQSFIFKKQSGIFLPQSLQSSRRRSVGCALAKAPALVRESVHEVKGVPESRQTAAKICFFVFCFQLSFAMIPVKMPSFLKKEQYL
ncbi:MAG: hypothetical protein MSH34_03195 [Oscillospiraceae bacterium]|nr:hypothetical protein [Oscillospiraceae bacterium]MDD7292405.1 hypothetical protein [Clostridiaceae bacterium]MDY5991090.1 hypothetical protein [Oscillospiraceae bacterium]